MVAGVTEHLQTVDITETVDIVNIIDIVDNGSYIVCICHIDCESPHLSKEEVILLGPVNQDPAVGDLGHRAQVW